MKNRNNLFLKTLFFQNGGSPDRQALRQQRKYFRMANRGARGIQSDVREAKLNGTYNPNDYEQRINTVNDWYAKARGENTSNSTITSSIVNKRNTTQSPVSSKGVKYTSTIPATESIVGSPTVANGVKSGVVRPRTEQSFEYPIAKDLSSGSMNVPLPENPFANYTDEQMRDYILQKGINGQERRDLLGDRYGAVQREINKYYAQLEQNKKEEEEKNRQEEIADVVNNPEWMEKIASNIRSIPFMPNPLRGTLWRNDQVIGGQTRFLNVAGLDAKELEALKALGYDTSAIAGFTPSSGFYE